MSTQIQIHKNNISTLKPNDSWVLLIDETGHFETHDKGRKGAVCGLLIPSAMALTPIRGEFHLKDNKGMEFCKTMAQSLSMNGLGLLGIKAGSIYGDHRTWMSNISDLIYLILVLLPIQEKVKIDIYIEARGSEDAPEMPQYTKVEDFQRLSDQIKSRLSFAFPSRSKSINFTLQLCNKYNNKWQINKANEHPYTQNNISLYNAYIDFVTAVMFWDKNDERIKKYHEMFKWSPACVFNEKESIISDCLREGHRITPVEFDRLLKNEHNDIVKRIMNEYGIVKENWENYVKYVSEQLNSKTINMKLLKDQLTFLKQYEPQQSELPKKLHLLWLTIQLADANHSGKSLPQFKKEFDKLCDELYDEDAPLVCKAQLHLAVSYTNVFKFSDAMDLMKPWEERPIAIPGLQYYGEVLSSYGQHYAFLKDYQSAIAYFNDALDIFKKLSDALDVKRESSQTGCYKIIARLEAKKPIEEIQEELKIYFETDNISTTIRQIFKEECNINEYQHHLLLRYMIECKDESRIKVYLNQKEKWNHGVGHPWEFIQTYRAFLTDDIPQRIELLQKAIGLTQGGITMLTIKVSLLAILYIYDKNVKNELETLLEKLSNELPGFGEENFNLLKNHINAPSDDPIKLLHDLLPFNFK